MRNPAMQLFGNDRTSLGGTLVVDNNLEAFMSRRHLDDHWVHELAGTTPPKPSSTTAAHLDRRQSERVSLGAKVRYMSEAPVAVEVEAQLLDISKKGCRIDTGSVLEV